MINYFLSDRLETGVQNIRKASGKVGARIFQRCKLLLNIIEGGEELLKRLIALSKERA